MPVTVRYDTVGYNRRSCFSDGFGSLLSSYY
jgi:hypothetical protein